MTLFYFADTRFPIERANGAQTMATCQALAKRGHHITLVVRPDTAAVPRDPFAFYDLPKDERLTIQHIPAAGHPKAKRVRFLLSAATMAARAGGLVYTRDLGLAAFLLQAPLGRRARVIYESHGIADVVADELPRLLGKPAARPSRRKLARLARREARVWKHAAAYVTITGTLADDLRTRFGSRDRLFVVPDGAKSAPPLEPEAGTEHAGAHGRIVVGYAGHLYPWKGVDVLVQALARVPDVDGLIVGGHPAESDRQRIETLARDLGVLGRLALPGMIAPAAVPAALSRADILVLPNTASTISERYTSPLKLFEYLALGRAIVASNLPALREVLTDETTALFVAPGDIDGLAAAIRRLAADAALRSRLSTAAHALADDYTWDRRAERLEPVLEAAVA